MDCETLIIIGIASIILLYLYKKHCDNNAYERFVIADNTNNLLPPPPPPPPTPNKEPPFPPSPPNKAPVQTNWDSEINNNSVFASEEGNNEVNPRVQLSRSTCYPQTKLKAEDLLPKDTQVSDFVNNNPSAEGVLKNINFLTAGYNIGVNTVGQTLRNANLQLRSEPPNPQVAISPWQQSTIAPDILRKPFEIDEDCTL